MQLSRDELQKTVNKYGALVNNPVINLVPNFVKRPVMKAMQKNSHKEATTIFTNLGNCVLPAELDGIIGKLRFINGDTRYYGLVSTCSCITVGDTLTVCWSQANRDRRWFNECVGILCEQGLRVDIDELERNS